MHFISQVSDNGLTVKENTDILIRPASHVVPPILGQHNATWTEIFSHVSSLRCYGIYTSHPKTLDQFDLHSLWTSYDIGEEVTDKNGQAMLKPPIRVVKECFSHWWRNISKVCFSFIPVGDATLTVSLFSPP